MAYYDIDASPATVVPLWLAQFTIAADGAITYNAGADTFHVYWIHRSLQAKVYDFDVSGDDLVSMGSPNPSSSAALGKIITLRDHTTNYGVNYTVTDEVMEYHFGGSVSQNGGDDEYYGLSILGTVATPMPIKIIQNGANLTSHWGNGKNQTAANILARICIKGKSGGSLIDNGIIVAKLDTWGYTFAFWETQLGLGESVASLSSEGDPQNDSVEGTVAAYGISLSTGYNLLSIDGGASKPFIGEWSRSPQSSNKHLYEFGKSLIVDGAVTSLHGVPAAEWTNRLVDVAVNSGSGTWVNTNNEALSWGTGATAGTGTLLGVDNNTGSSTSRLILHLNTGVIPSSGVTITGGTTSATAVLTADSVALPSHPHHLGQYTGAWIGAQGMGLTAGELTAADSTKDLDGLIITPLDSRTIQVNVEVGLSGDVPHVFLTKKDPVLDAPHYDMYTTLVAAGSGGGTVDVGAAIASDTPKQGWLGVKHGADTYYTYYEYSDWNSQTFTLVGTTSKAISLNDEAGWAFFYEPAIGGGTTKSLARSFVFNAGFDVRGWARHADPAKQIDVWQPLNASIAGDATLSVTLIDEA